MNNVDARQVLQMFAALDSKRQKKAHRTALRKATGILVRETRKNFRKVVKNPNARNRWNGKPFLLESNLRSIRKPQRVKYILWETLD